MQNAHFQNYLHEAESEMDLDGCCESLFVETWLTGLWAFWFMSKNWKQHYSKIIWMAILSNAYLHIEKNSQQKETDRLKDYGKNYFSKIFKPSSKRHTRWLQKDIICLLPKLISLISSRFSNQPTLVEENSLKVVINGLFLPLKFQTIF